MAEIVSTLHWIKGRFSNAYLWIGENGLVLIDTGMPGDVETILNYIIKIGRPITDLYAILITHADKDHVGGAAAIQERTGAVVYASKETAALMAVGEPPEHKPMPRLVNALVSRFMKYNPVPKAAIRIIGDGLTIPDVEGWQVLATPGHTADHHAFFNLSQGLLLTGDALDMRGGKLSSSPARFTADMTAARKSARRLLRLAPAIIACGHGDPLLDFTAGDIMILDRQLS